MPEPKQKETGDSSHDTPKPPSKLNVIVNPEETVGVPLQPAYVSLGIKSERFKKEVGGTAS